MNKPLNARGEVSFQADLRDLILANLPLRPTAAARRAELDAMSTKALLIVYYNWRNRLVHPHRRLVRRSGTFVSAMANTTHGIAIGHVLDKIASGQPVDPYLSPRKRFGWEPGRKRNARDFDPLLNDWGIHHLHICLSPNRLEHDNDLLAIIFKPGVAYVLDIIKHGEWTATRLVETAVRTWPEEKLFVPLHGVLPGADWTADERWSLREAGMPGVVTIDGVPFVSTVCMSTARTTFDAARHAFATIYRFAYLEGHPKELTSRFEKAGSLAGVRLPRSPRYRAVAVTNPCSFGFGIEEVATGLVMGII